MECEQATLLGWDNAWLRRRRRRLIELSSEKSPLFHISFVCIIFIAALFWCLEKRPFASLNTTKRSTKSIHIHRFSSLHRTDEEKHKKWIYELMMILIFSLYSLLNSDFMMNSSTDSICQKCPTTITRLKQRVKADKIELKLLIIYVYF